MMWYNGDHRRKSKHGNTMKDRGSERRREHDGGMLSDSESEVSDDDFETESIGKLTLSHL